MGVKISLYIGIIATVLMTSIVVFNTASAQENTVPSWIKNNAGWWAEGQIDDTAFLQGIQYLIKEGIMVIPETTPSEKSSEGIPEWIKNNAGWWAEGLIGDNDFVSGIQFLIQNGIIAIEQPPSIVQDPEKEIQLKADAIMKTWGLTGCERDTDTKSNWKDITYYKVTDGKIVLDDNLDIPSDLKEWQIYDDKHHEAWSIFSKIVPEQYMDEVVWFTIFTDGLEWLEMDVYLEENSDQWSLLFDIVDWYCLGELREDNVTFTMIHEFGHMISLDPTQIDVDYVLRDFSYEEMNEFYDALLQKEQECGPRIATTYGCAKEDSYINAFAQKFQAEKYSDSITYNFKIYSNEWTEELWNFYTSYEDEYVTDYAASSTQEDFAETFTFFILSEKPQGNSVLEQKILFFYDYVELVEIRDYIRNNL